MSQIICTFAPNMKRVYAILLLLVAFSMSLWAQEQQMSVAERNAAQGFNDTIDRLDPNFVLVSLCIADPTDWHDDVLGMAGHAFLRLQCPTFGLDYCFSYEGERVNDNIYQYLSGKTKMGMFAVPTNEYLEDFRHWNRSVHEYRLNMPPEAEQRLWEIMDNHITNKISLRHDLNKYGCAITIVKFVKQALGETPIVYASDPEMEHMTRREIGYRSLANHPWFRLVHLIISDNKADKQIPIDEKLIVPVDLAEVWQHASVVGQPFATHVGDIVEGAPLDNSKPWFTPMLTALLILIITIGFACTRYPYWDLLLLGFQALLGCVLLFLWIVMREFGGAAYILMALFNPLPLIVWRWRNYWALPYAILLAMGVIVLACWPHMLVDPAFLVLAVAYVVLFVKDSIKRIIASLCINHK
jgi:hypothetical protein